MLAAGIHALCFRVNLGRHGLAAATRRDVLKGWGSIAQTPWSTKAIRGRCSQDQARRVPEAIGGRNWKAGTTDMTVRDK